MFLGLGLGLIVIAFAMAAGTITRSSRSGAKENDSATYAGAAFLFVIGLMIFGAVMGL